MAKELAWRNVPEIKKKTTSNLLSQRLEQKNTLISHNIKTTLQTKNHDQVDKTVFGGL